MLASSITLSGRVKPTAGAGSANIPPGLFPKEIGISVQLNVPLIISTCILCMILQRYELRHNSLPLVPIRLIDQQSRSSSPRHKQAHSWQESSWNYHIIPHKMDALQPASSPASPPAEKQDNNLALHDRTC